MLSELEPHNHLHRRPMSPHTVLASSISLGTSTKATGQLKKTPHLFPGLSRDPRYLRLPAPRLPAFPPLPSLLPPGVLKGWAQPRLEYGRADGDHQEERKRHLRLSVVEEVGAVVVRGSERAVRGDPGVHVDRVADPGETPLGANQV